MSYHVSEGLSGDLDFAIDWKSTGYLGLNLGTDAITKAILQSGSADDSALASYGAAAGAAGAAAACAATGAGAAVMGVCGSVGSAIGKVLGGQIGKPASGGSVAWKFVDTWNGIIVPYLKEAQRGSLAIRAYLTNRDVMLDDAADIIGGNRTQAHAWANQWLYARGAPPAPVHKTWDPSMYSSRWNAFKIIADWASKENLGAYAFPFSGKLMASIEGKSAGTYALHEEMCSLKNKTGLSCFQIALLKYYPTGIPSPPGAPIDWGMVGAFQVVRAANTMNLARDGYGCKPDECVVDLNLPNPGQLGSYPAGTVLTGKIVSPYGYKPTEITAHPIVTADVIPSHVANGLNVKLAELRPQLIVEAGKKAGKQPKLVAVPRVSRFGWQATVGGAILLGGAAAGAWLLARK